MVALRIRAEPAKAARKRRLFLSRDEIVEAAAAILERYGYDGLNMRSVATALGVRAAALYRYVDNREALDDLLFDHLMAGATPELAGQDWCADLRVVAQAWRGRLAARRDATRIDLGKVSIGPNVLPLMEASLHTLRRSGLGDDEVIEAYQSMTLFVHSFAQTEATYRNAASPTGGSDPPFPPDPDAWAQLYPTVAAMIGRLGEPADFDKRFAFGLDALIAAIERQAPRRAATDAR